MVIPAVAKLIQACEEYKKNVMAMESSELHSSSYLAGRAGYMLEKQLMTDVELVVGSNSQKTTFKAHKLILALGSPVFEAMFYGTLAETSNVINLEDDPKGFSALLRYLYTDETNVPGEWVIETISVAMKYLVKPLVKACCLQLEQHITIETACEFLQVASLFNCSLLTLKCLQIIDLEAERILKEEHLRGLDAEIVSMILRRSSLRVDSELTVIQAALGWARNECLNDNADINPKNISDNLQPIAKYLLFHQVPRRDLQFLNFDFTNFLLPQVEQNEDLHPRSYSPFWVLNLTTSETQCVVHIDPMKAKSVKFEVNRSILLMGIGFDRSNICGRGGTLYVFDDDQLLLQEEDLFWVHMSDVTMGLGDQGSNGDDLTPNVEECGGPCGGSGGDAQSTDSSLPLSSSDSEFFRNDRTPSDCSDFNSHHISGPAVHTFQAPIILQPSHRYTVVIEHRFMRPSPRLKEAEQVLISCKDVIFTFTSWNRDGMIITSSDLSETPSLDYLLFFV